MISDAIPANKNEMISVEYCHIDPYGDYKKSIAEANYWVPKIIEGFKKDHKLQLCIMLDDVHTDFEMNDKFIDKILGLLDVQPDTIYLESSFHHQASAMLKHLMENGQDSRSKDDIELVLNLQQKRMWIREHVKAYKLQTEFMVSYDRSGEGEDDPSCPSLAAASYFYRLGKKFDSGTIPSAWGEDIAQADRCLNILNSYYVQVEDKAQAIIQAIDVDYLRKNSWFFY